MRSLLLAVATTLALFTLAPAPGHAQPAAGTNAAPSTAPSTEPGTTPRRRRTRAPSTAAKPKREPTAGQLASRERMRKCGAEWKVAKAQKTTGGLRWPQYWHQCNQRLKGNQA